MSGFGNNLVPSNRSRQFFSIVGAVPGLSLSAADAARGGDERHSLLPLTPMHRSLSEKSFRSAQSPNSDSRHPSLTPGDLNRSSLSGENTASRTSGIEVRRGSSERSCPSLYKDYDALQGVQAAEVQDTLFLDNDLYEGTHSACDDSDADGDYARPDDVRKGESEGEDIYEIQGDKEEQTDGEYEIPEDVRASRLEEDGDDIYEVPGNARTDDVQLPPRMPSPLSSDYTSSEGDVAQPQTRVEYYTAPMCSHCGQGCQQSCQGSKEHGYDPVYVPRHDADGMARRLDACNYYKPRSESTITSPYEEISTDTVYAVQEEVSSPAPVDDEDLDNDIPYATSEFIAYNNAMANNDSPELPPRNKSMIDLVIPPSPQSDSDPSTWQNTVPLRRPPPLVPRQRPQTTEANSRNSQPPPLLQPRAKSWAPKGRSDSVNSDYEPYDFSLARQQHQNA